ncbi:MAG: hypothetical protein FD129_2670, partial [bacterium]
ALRGGYVNARPYYETVGRLVGAVADSGWSVAAHDIGAIGWYGRTRVVDLLGLVDRDLARGRVGATELIDRERPDLIVLHYDNRATSAETRARWRGLESTGLDSLYRPIGDEPEEFPYLRVRHGREASIRERLHSLGFGRRGSDSSPMVIRHRALAAWLLTHQPDGLPYP